MNIDEIKSLCDKLVKEREELVKLKTKLAMCNLSGHQNNVSVTIQGVGSIYLTEVSRDTGYAARLIRGREMIMLGVKKSLSYMVDQQSDVVKLLEDKISNAKITA